MSNELLHTPGGVRDIYGSSCAQKLAVQGDLQKMIHSYGFQDIQTPTFEYFDIFNKERGTVASDEMFKFFDRGNNTLVLRPDMTPSIARCVAKYCREEQMQIRFCYTAQTFVNTKQYKGKLQEVTQIGAELFHDDSSDADAEMIALTIECLLQSGLQEFQLEVGHADLFRGLVEEAGFAQEETEKLRDLIETKNFFGVEDLLEQLTVSQGLREIFMKLPDIQGDLSKCVEYIKERTQSTRVMRALERLQKLETILKLYGFMDYVTIDMSMLSHYSYYTGVIFRAYTYGNGEAVASGGRYDGLVGQFGMEVPAIGLAIVLDQLMIALERQKRLQTAASSGILLLYPKEAREKALTQAAELRAAGETVQMLRKSSKVPYEEYEEYARRNGNERILYITEES